MARHRAFIVALLAVVGLIVGLPVNASAQSESLAFRCSQSRGHSFYAPGGITPPSRQGWSEGTGVAEFLILIGPENGPGGADIRYRDATGVLQSHAASGAEVSFIGRNLASDSLRIEVFLGGLNTETIVVADVRQPHPTLIWTQIRGGGLIVSVQTFVARCDRI